MRSRSEYEKILDKTFSLAGEAQGVRIQVDLLLDIRELLLWLRDDITLQRVLKERQLATQERIRTIDISF